MKLARTIAATICSVFAMTLGVAQAQDVVRITNIGHGYYAGPLYVAMREHLFEKHGLKPDVTFVKGGALALQAVLNRNADFGVLSYEHVLTAAAQGRDLVAVFNVTTRPLNNVIVNSALYAPNKDKSLEERVRALKGQKIGTPSAGGSGEKMLGVLARQYGLQIPGDIELVYLGADAGAYVAAFQSKLISAAMPFEPAGVEVEQRGLGHTLINLMNGELPEFRDLIFMTLATNPDTVRDKPDLVKKMVATFAEAQKILLDPERGKAIMGQEFSEMSPALNDKAYDVVRQIWSKDGRMTADGGKKVFDYLKPAGDHPIDYSKTFTNAFIP